MWAFATGSLCTVGLAEGLFTDAASDACDRITEFKPQELSNLVWAYATLDLVHVPLFRTARRRLVDQLESLRLKTASLDCLQAQAWDTSSAVWALAQAKEAQHGAQAAALRRGLMRITRAVDAKRRGATQRQMWPLREATPSVSSTVPTEPRLVLDLVDRMVLEKPPAWQVYPADRAYGSGRQAEEQKEPEGGSLELLYMLHGLSPARGSSAATLGIASAFCIGSTFRARAFCSSRKHARHSTIYGGSLPWEASDASTWFWPMVGCLLGGEGWALECSGRRMQQRHPRVASACEASLRAHP